MKMPVSFSWMPGLLLAMAGLPVGLAQNQISPPANTPVTTLAASNVVTIVSRDITPLSADASTRSVVVANQTLPTEMSLSPWTKEIVKLAQSGIDDDVVLSFIDNSGLFNLGSDQIIYLSDLGVSGQIISEMLRHDREVMAGVRPVTVASEPPMENSIPESWKTKTGVSSKAKMQSATATAPKDSATLGLLAGDAKESLVAAQRNEPVAQPVVAQYAMASDATPVTPPVSDESSQSSGSKNELYPVREPYPVELLPPIVFRNEAQVPANTIIIVGFPRTTP